MYPRLLCLFLFAAPFCLSAQSLADFEDLDLEPDTFRNGEEGSGGFASGNVFLPNTFVDFGTFSSWTGWAISSITDNQTPGFSNQYSAIAGQGADMTDTYAVAYAADSAMIRLTAAAAGGVVEGLYITNSTYAYFSMRDGDAFAKRFGGETGDEPDFFRLTLRGYFQGTLTTDSVDFYLADFRFEDRAEDYIIDSWTYVDLSGLGPVDSLRCTLTSSDVGVFGMNTPAYFCVDRIATRDGLVGSRPPGIGPPLEVFPNPASDHLRLRWPEVSDGLLHLSDMQGRVVRRIRIQSGLNELSLRGLPTGSYVATLLYEGRLRSKIFVRK